MPERSQLHNGEGRRKSDNPKADPTPVLRHIPNILTSLRLLLAVYFPFAAVAQRVPIVAVALLTEYLDGAIARRYGVASRTGQILDPIADKLFFFALAFTFVSEGALSSGEAAFLGLRDLCVLLAVVWTFARGRQSLIGEMMPLRLGKALTTAQYLVGFDILLTGRLHAATFYPTAALSLMATVQYWRAFKRLT